MADTMFDLLETKGSDSMPELGLRLSARCIWMIIQGPFYPNGGAERIGFYLGKFGLLALGIWMIIRGSRLRRPPVV